MLHLNTFGEKTFRKQKWDVLTLFLQDANEETSRVCVLSFPTICSPLPSRVDANNYPHLHGLKLADYSDSEDSIDVLIGSDYYWDFVTSESFEETLVPLQSIANLVGYCQAQQKPLSINKKPEIATACLITPKMPS